MKKIFLLPALALFMACNDSSKTEETTTDSSKMNAMTDTTTTKPAMITNDFVTAVANVGMMEVELGKMAQSSGSNSEVKDFGKMMETDHTASVNKLREVAAAENISVPSSMSTEHQGHVAMFQGMTGAEFDKAYMHMMVTGHTDMIKNFNDAIANNPNEKVKEFAKSSLATVQKHLDAAKKIKGKLK